MKQNQTPLFDALSDYIKRQRYSFHVPGHKDGLTFHPKGKGIFKDLMKIDATELDGLDDLYFPNGPIEQAQLLLSDLYNTYKSYLLVNGSTVGNLVMIKATCRPGDTILVQRNSHKSIFNALKLAKVNPVFMAPVIDQGTKMGVMPDSEMIINAIDKHPKARALVLTYPNYYGLTADIEEAIVYAKRKGLMVLVDEAHGAHFQLGFPFPKSTLAMGADLVVHSAHKTLPAMTMGSYLHLNTEYISEKKVEKVLAMLQTSSPSYPIMASLDLARAYLASLQKQDIIKIIHSISFFENELYKIDGLSIVKIDQKYKSDPLKIVVKSTKGKTGFQLKEDFQKIGIYPEMADLFQVVFILSLDYDVPYNEISRDIKVGLKGSKDAIHAIADPTPIENAFNGLDTLDISYNKMEILKTREIPLQKAKGQISAQMVIPYPPGVPLIIEGEQVSEKHIDTIIQWQQSGAHFQGLMVDPETQQITIEVYEQEIK